VVDPFEVGFPHSDLQESRRSWFSADLRSLAVGGVFPDPVRNAAVEVLNLAEASTSIPVSNPSSL
jgi:hypothetical protein